MNGMLLAIFMLGCIAGFFTGFCKHESEIQQEVDDYNIIVDRYRALRSQIREAGMVPCDDNGSGWEHVVLKKRY